MKPKNSKERRTSFLKFLGLFLLTVSMILLVVYFNFNVPKKENDLLRQQATVIENDREFQGDFFSEMEAVKKMMDSLDRPGAQVLHESSLISAKLAEMENTIPTKDSTYLYDMHMSIVDTYADMLENKGKLKELSESEKLIDDYAVELEKCEQLLRDTERQVIRLRN